MKQSVEMGSSNWLISNVLRLTSNSRERLLTHGTFDRLTELDMEFHEGVLLPQKITEFANAGILVGMALVNLAEDPKAEFNGFYGACSTYGFLVYLKYGLFRLFSQMAQDCQFKFGIFSLAVTQSFLDRQIINLHPWEHNEVPIVLGVALKQIEVPDRLG